MFNIIEAAEELQSEVGGQDTPYPVYMEDFVKFIVRAIKKFYVDINHPDDYDRTLLTINEDEEVCYDHDFGLDEEVYIIILAKMFFFKMAITGQTGDNAKSYTTNALSVTGADKGFKSIQQILDDLECERLRVYYKMTRYTMG